MPNTDIEVGSAAPDFKLQSNEQIEIGLSNQRGKKVILFFGVGTTEFNAERTSPCYGA